MSDIDRYLTDEVVEKAARAEWEHEWPERSWERAPFANQDFYKSVAHTSLSAVLPDIIRQAKAEALREAACYGPLHFAATHRDHWSRGRLLVTQAWLRDRADEIAGDDS